MVKKVIFLFIFLFMFIPLFSAAPPIQVIEGNDKGILIRYPAYETVPQNTGFKLHTHIFNKSDGQLLTNSTSSCLLHLYQPNGSHVLEKAFDFDSNGVDFEMEIGAGNFSTLGTHAFIIQCTNSDAGGAIAGVFMVTYSGKELTTAQAILYVGLLSMFILFFILILFFMSKLPEENEQEENGEFVQRSWLKYLRSTFVFIEWILIVSMLFITSNLAFIYLGEQLVAKMIFSLYQIMFALTFPLIVVWLIWIVSSIARDKKMKRYIEKGIFPEKYNL